jgi:hypothetical protein
MSRPSEPATDPSLCRAIPINCAATSAGVKSATPPRAELCTAGFVPGADPGCRSAESGGGLGAGGPEARAA